MKKSTLADLPELVAAGLIDETQVERIRAYYAGSARSSRVPLLVFALVGALLLGAGVIQIFAYNWEMLPRLLRAGIAVFITVPPLVAAAYGRMRRPDSAAWREAPAALLVLMIGGSIGLMAQIYHVIPGDIPFTLLWSALALPVVFYTGAVSAVIGLAVIASVYLGLWFESLPTWPFWILYCVVVGYAVRSCADPSRFASRLLQTTVLAMSGCILFRVYIDSGTSNIIIMPCALAGAAYLASAAEFRAERFPAYPLRIIPAAFMILIMAVFSFTEPWDDLGDNGWALLAEGFGGTDIPATVFGLAVLALYPLTAAAAFRRLRSADIPFAVFPAFFAGMIGVAQVLTADVAMIAMSVFIFGSGVLLAARGVMEQSFGKLNLGMIMTAWILLVRFFDSDISLLFKGIVFLILGAGFIGMNMLLARRRV